MKTRRLFGKKNDESYGIVGEVLDMTYSNGEPLQVGDFVRCKHMGSDYAFDNFVVKKEKKGFVMGVLGSKFEDGKSSNFEILEVKKFYEIEPNKESDEIKIIESDGNKKHTLELDGIKAELSHESFLELKKLLEKLQ